MSSIFKKTFMVVKDNHGDTFASEFRPSIGVRRYIETAGLICTCMGIEGDNLQYGIVMAPDAGAARIATNIRWIGSFSSTLPKKD